MRDFKETDIAIITTETVEKTFLNEDAYLYSRIELLVDDAHQKIKVYKIRTDLCNYKEVDNENVLTWLELKQDWYHFTVTYNEIDAFAESIESQIPEGLTKTEKELLQLKTIFLLQRQQQEPWGIPSDKWKIAEAEDLIKTI